MTTDPNWLKSITESYRQEVSQSARNLQEEAENLYNLVETIQTALNADFTEEQVDALINMFEGKYTEKELEEMYPYIDLEPHYAVLGQRKRTKSTPRTPQEQAAVDAIKAATKHNHEQQQRRMSHWTSLDGTAEEQSAVYDEENKYAKLRAQGRYGDTGR